MNRWLKITIVVLATIIGIILFGYGGCVGCVHIIAKSNSCEMYNIDNVELRARIDIPKIDRDFCYCVKDKAASTKTNYFKIRTNEVDMDRYIERNSLISVDETDLDLSAFEKLTKVPEITDDNKQLFYYSAGESDKTEWLSIVNKESGDLWVHIQSKD
ncbi:hypothetical protein LJB75_00280 [Bacteroidales bacterium OttesenSCG-928-L19]|nr:hypothetical protein [Bacteroidales bacterium OttesenSCG-928-L19]